MHQDVERAAPSVSPASVTHSDIIPWIDAAPPPYWPPTTSTPPVPPSNARPCSAADVSVAVDSQNGAGGHSVTWLRFRNRSSSTCLLAGYPTVTATEPGRIAVVGSPTTFFTGGHSANMLPGGSTSLGLESDSECAAHPGGASGDDVYHHFSIALPGGGTVSVTVPGNRFDLSCGLFSTLFEDPDYPQPTLVYPLEALTAKIVLPHTAHAGQDLEYEIDLHNPTTKSLRLDPCPGYLEAANSSTWVKTRYALNCAPVADIASGATVRYAMQLQIPGDTPAGPLRIIWSLDGSGATDTGTVLSTH